MARIVFLGRLADLAGVLEREVAATPATGFNGLLALLDPPLVEALRDEKVRIAVNGVLTPRPALAFGPGDEVALLPPVSGG